MVALVQAPLLFIGIILLFVHSGESIECYVCNSHTDKSCDQDVPKDTFKKNCENLDNPHKNNNTPVEWMCRKILQTIEVDTNGNQAGRRYIRSCGYVAGDYKNKCYKRSGFGGRQEVCTCLTDYCNNALGNLGSVSYLTLAFFTGLSLLVARL